MYLKLLNGVVDKYPYSINQLRRDNPQTSFPQNPTATLLAQYDVYLVSNVVPPSYDTLTQTCTEETPAQIDGVWTQQWAVQNLPQDQAESNVRSKRDGLLTACDWVVIKSVEVEVPEIQDWKDYRQALRDIPQQAGFPWSVNWPEQP